MKHAFYETEIVRLIRQQPGLARSQIGRALGLSKSMAERMVQDLIRRRVLAEDVGSLVRQGRGGIPVTLHAAGPMAIGVSLFETTAEAIAIDMRQQVLEQLTFSFATDIGSDALLGQIDHMVEQLLAIAARESRSVLGIGFGDPGIVDTAAGIALRAVHLPNWHDVHLAAHFADRFDLPLELLEANGAHCVYEHHYGAGREIDNFMYVTLSHGVGLGVLTGGRPYGGGQGRGCEIGHIAVQPGGPLCACGNRGCLEAIAGGQALVNQVSARLAVGEDSCLAVVPADTLTSDEIFKAAVANDPLASDVVARAGQALGAAIGSVCNLLNPQRVILGGDLSRYPALWQEAVSITESVALPSIAEQMDVVFANNHPQAAAIGVAELVFDRFLASTQTFPEFVTKTGGVS